MMPPLAQWKSITKTQFNHHNYIYIEALKQ